MMVQTSSHSKAFRLSHLCRFLEGYDPRRGPLDLALRSYGRSYPQLGSKDRAWIAEYIFLHEKLRGTLDALAGDDLDLRVEILEEGVDPKALERLPIGLRTGSPEWLWQRMVAQYGLERAEQLARVNLEEAPLFLRTNLVKATRDVLLQRLVEEGVEGAEACPENSAGIRLPSRTRVTHLAAYQEGLFEIQDLASQLIAEKVMSQPGETLLDYCAGAGGKSLAIAPRMLGRGQLFLHDVRDRALSEAKIRLRRAGVQNAQTVSSDSRPLRLLKGRCDWVLVDAPCSGSGTFRRNPEMKWRLSEEALQDLVQLQSQILQEATRFVKPKGKLVYATCSILNEENRQRVAGLQQQGWELVEEWGSVPTSRGMDGLYVAVVQRKGEEHASAN